MSKRIWSAVALGLAAVALAATGCSDSNDGNNPLNPGSLNDPDFQFVEQNIFDGAFDGIDVTFELSGMLLDSIPGAAPSRPRIHADAAIDGDFYLTSYSYNYINDWHVFQVGGYITDGFSGDTVDFSGTDSIQLIADGAPVQVPDSTMEGFDYRVHFDAWDRHTTDSLAGHHQMQIRLIDQTVIEMNGSLLEDVQFTHSDTAGSCDVHVQSSMSAQGIQMDFNAGGCPTQGGVTVNLSYAFECQGGGDNPWSLAATGLWTINGEFNGQTESYTFSNGENVWSVSQQCGGPAASGLW